MTALARFASSTVGGRPCRSHAAVMSSMPSSRRRASSKPSGFLATCRARTSWRTWRPADEPRLDPAVAGAIPRTAPKPCPAFYDRPGLRRAESGNATRTPSARRSRACWAIKGAKASAAVSRWDVPGTASSAIPVSDNPLSLVTATNHPPPPAPVPGSAAPSVTLSDRICSSATANTEYALSYSRV